MTDDTAIWFDLDGTLLAIDDYAVVLERACASVGIEGEERTTFVEAYDDEFLDALQSFRSEPYRHAASAGVAATDASADPDAFVDALFDAECANSRVPSAVRETLDTLGERHALGVLTNGVDEWQREKLAHHALDEAVDAVVVSEEAGAHKPDRTVFDLAADRIAADERWMVGDDREADVDGARAAGWNAVHVSGPDRLPTVLDHLDREGSRPHDE
jgi:haloacid dehalogenase superfamily, subfamily IA, variant 1 with third motif having Dx(3-4)D or Dx(3-4)E